jgi:hypothetical protein
MFRTYRVPFGINDWWATKLGSNPLIGWRACIEEPEFVDMVVGINAEDDFYVFRWSTELDSLRTMIADAEMERQGFVLVDYEYA